MFQFGAIDLLRQLTQLFKRRSSGQTRANDRIVEARLWT